MRGRRTASIQTNRNRWNLSIIKLWRTVARKVDYCFRPKHVRTGRRNKRPWGPALVRKYHCKANTQCAWVRSIKRNTVVMMTDEDGAGDISNSASRELSLCTIYRPGRSCAHKRPQKGFPRKGAKLTGGGGTRGTCRKRTKQNVAQACRVNVRPMLGGSGGF